MNEEDFRVVEAKIIALDMARTIISAIAYSKRISFFPDTNKADTKEENK